MFGFLVQLIRRPKISCTKPQTLPTWDFPSALTTSFQPILKPLPGFTWQNGASHMMSNSLSRWHLSCGDIVSMWGSPSDRTSASGSRSWKSKSCHSCNLYSLHTWHTCPFQFSSLMILLYTVTMLVWHYTASCIVWFGLFLCLPNSAWAGENWTGMAGRNSRIKVNKI